MQRVALAGEALGEIRIAFPESVRVAIGHPRESDVVGAIVASRSTPGQRVPVGVAQHFGGSVRASEITLAARVAPRALRIPMPRLDCEFRVLTVSDRLPARSQRFLQRRLL